MRIPWTRWSLLVGSLGLATLGQFYFAHKPDYVWDGLVFYAVAIVLFLALFRVQDRPPVHARSGFQLGPQVLMRMLPILVGLLLACVTVLEVGEARTSYWPIFWTWVAAIGLYLLGFARRPSWVLRVRPTWEWGLVALLVLGAWLLRVWHVASVPWTLGGDEGSQGLWARGVLEGRVVNMFGLGWLSVPNMSFFWQAMWLRLFGDDVLGLRLPWTIIGALTVLGTYLLVRRLFDRWLAVLTAFLLATYHFHIHFSRLGSNQIADPFFVVWALYFLVLGWQSRRRWAWAASGAVAGLAFYGYAGGRQVPVILALLLAWAIVTRPRFWREHRGDMLAMLGAFLVVFGPMGLLAIRDPDNFNARINQTGIFQSGWLAAEMQRTGRTRLSLLGEQVMRAFLAFNLYLDRIAWYNASIPLMDFVSSIFFALGAAFSVSRLRAKTDRAGEGKEGPGEAGAGWRYAVFVIWFLVVVGIGGALTENPPSSERLISSAVPAVFFVAVALRALAGVLGDLLAWRDLNRRVLAGGLAILMAYISVRYYFGPYQASWVYGNGNGEVATRVGYYLRELGPGWHEYFFGAPRMYTDFSSTPFIAKDVTLSDVIDPLQAPPKGIDGQHKLIFVFLPERGSELKWVEQEYPGGTLEQVHRFGQPAGPLLFIAYKVT